VLVDIFHKFDKWKREWSAYKSTRLYDGASFREEKTCQFYAVGLDENHLFSYDEYDAKGDGRYFTSDLLMIERYTASEAKEVRESMNKRFNDNLRVYLVTITRFEGKYTTSVSLMWDRVGEDDEDE
jgi:hypothetical protein